MAKKNITNQDILEAVNDSFGEVDRKIEKLGQKVDVGFKELGQSVENVELKCNNFIVYRKRSGARLLKTGEPGFFMPEIV